MPAADPCAASDNPRQSPAAGGRSWAAGLTQPAHFEYDARQAVAAAGMAGDPRGGCVAMDGEAAVTASGDGPRGGDRPLRAAFALALVAALAPLLCATRPFTLDGPIHLASARYALDCLRGQAPAAQLFEVDLRTPNLAAEGLLGVALAAGVAPLTAERLIAALCVLALPLCTWYLARTIDRRKAPLAAVLVLPLAHSRAFTSGLYSFLLALGLALLVIACAWSKAARRDRAGRGALALALLGVWYAHLIGYAVALLAVALLACERRRDVDRRGICLAALPSLLLSLWFVLHQADGVWRRGPDLVARLERLATASIVERGDLSAWLWPLFGVVLLTACGVAAAHAWRRRTVPAVRIGVAFCVFLAAYLLVPDAAGNAWLLHARFALAVWIAGAVWLSIALPRGIARAALASGAVLLSLAGSADLTAAWRRADALLAATLPAAELIEDGAVLVSYQLSPRGVLVDAQGEIPHARFTAAGFAAGLPQTVVDVDNYAACFPYFAVRFKLGRAPGSAIPTVADVHDFGSGPIPHSVDPHRVSLATWAARLGAAPRYVLLLGDEHDQPAFFPDDLRRDNLAAAATVRGGLLHHYALIHAVAGPTPVALYRLAD